MRRTTGRKQGSLLPIGLIPPAAEPDETHALIQCKYADHLSVRVTTDTAGLSIGEHGHYPFGEALPTNSGISPKQKFTSHERDSESGNDYAMFRFHVSRFGRFNRPDPWVSRAVKKAGSHSVRG